MLALYLGITSFAIWLIIAILPWRPWSTREALDASPDKLVDLSNLTILIPARNEAEVIQKTLSGLLKQTQNTPIVVVDDQSTDDTVQLISDLQNDSIQIISGQTTPAGWSGKLYALEQGRQHVKTDYLLLLDADILLNPGTITSLLKKMQDDDLSLLSLMAQLKMHSLWEKLLMPGFIYFFKLLYPFHLSNKPGSRIAAAAGGCILLKTSVLDQLGGFSVIKDALIDDCSLAKAVKKQGYTIWTGLTHSAISLRSYNTLSSIWLMVSRTAFTQLHYSFGLLFLCMVLMLLSYVIPVVGLVYFKGLAQLISLFALLLMLILYLPTLKFYNIQPLWCLTLPFAACLYMIMTCDSALKYWVGEGAEWKGRQYPKQ